MGAELSDAAGASDRRFWRRRSSRHCRAIDRSIAVGATRAIVCHREPQWRRQQYCRRSRRACARGRLYATPRHGVECDQRHPLRQARFNLVRDIAPVAAIVRVPLVMEVHPSVPARTVAEFIAHAKANSGKINLASAGIGSTTHVAGEMFKMMAGLDLLHVPYRGPQVISALLAGDVPQVYFGPLLSSIEYVRTGKLRALAVTTATRSPILPDIPALSETLPDYEASTWFGVGAPKATPAEIVNKLNKEVNAALDDPKMKARLADFGGTPLRGSPAEFGKLIAEETEKWGKVIRAANIKPQG